MSIIALALFVLFGLFLFLVEFLIVPGITIAGIAGAALVGGSVYLAFHYHGPGTGLYFLIGTALAVFLTIYLSLKSKTWKRLMLNDNIMGHVNESQEDNIKQGDTGMALTRLNPFGRAIIKENIMEVCSNGEYIKEKTPLEVVKVQGFKIIVKPKI